MTNPDWRPSERWVSLTSTARSICYKTVSSLRQIAGIKLPGIYWRNGLRSWSRPRALAMVASIPDSLTKVRRAARSWPGAACFGASSKASSAGKSHHAAPD